MVTGIFATYFKDSNQTRKWREKEKKLAGYLMLTNRARSLEKFFNDNLPTEYSGMPWYTRWYKKIEDEHDWFGVFLPFHPNRGSAMSRFTIGMGKVVNFMFIDTILAGLFFVDTGACAEHTDQESCTFLRSLNQIDSLCAWNHDEAAYDAAVLANPGDPVSRSEYNVCEFNQLGTEFLSQLILVVCITSFVIPLDIMFASVVYKVEGLYFQMLEARDRKLEQEVKEIAAAAAGQGQRHEAHE